MNNFGRLSQPDAYAIAAQLRGAGIECTVFRVWTPEHAWHYTVDCGPWLTYGGDNVD